MNGLEVLIPIAFFVSTASIVRMILRHKERRMELEAGRFSTLGQGDGAVRLERMEQAIDAMAVEIERLSEAQRFHTKLLTERLPQGTRGSLAP
jgi:hypothetical protein